MVFSRTFSGLLLVIFTVLALATPQIASAIDYTNLGGPVNTNTYISLSNVPQGGMAHIAVEIDVQHPWHINAHVVDEDFLVPTDITFETREGITIREVVYPTGVKKKLEFSEIPMALYEGKVYFGAIVEVAADFPLGNTTLNATLTYQACDNEKCLLPETIPLFVQMVVSDPHAAVDLTHAEIFDNITFAASTDEDGGFGSTVASRGLFFSFILVFLGGLALNLTPCVYPMIPITVSYFGGQSGGRGSKTVMLAVLYLLGMATMYSALGLVAALTGSLFGAALQNPLVLGFVALVMVTLALSMFGLYEIRVPSRLANVAGTGKQGAAGSYLMGMTVGIVAAPCIGPFVLGLLTFVGESGNPLLGFTMFFTLALGLGLPFVVLAIASSNISKLPKSGQWMEWIRKLFGFILLGMGLFFLEPLLSNTLYYGLLAALFVIGGISLGFVLKAASATILFNTVRRFIGVAAPLYGIYLLVAPGNLSGSAHVGVEWEPYNVTAIAQAKAEGRPVMIDFSANWCLPCKELDRKTFSQDVVVDATAGFTRLKADLTRASSDEVKKLREKYNIRGVPTIVFIDKNGNERKDLRVVKFVHADEFLDRVTALQN